MENLLANRDQALAERERTVCVLFAVGAALMMLSITDRVTRENRLPETRVGIGCHVGSVHPVRLYRLA